MFYVNLNKLVKNRRFAVDMGHHGTYVALIMNYEYIYEMIYELSFARWVWSESLPLAHTPLVNWWYPVTTNHVIWSFNRIRFPFYACLVSNLITISIFCKNKNGVAFIYDIYFRVRACVLANGARLTDKIEIKARNEINQHAFGMTFRIGPSHIRAKLILWVFFI